MWSEIAGSLPDPDTLIQFLLTPMNKPNEETAPKKNETKQQQQQQGQQQQPQQQQQHQQLSVSASEADDAVRKRISQLERRMDAMRTSPRQSQPQSPPQPQSQYGWHDSRSPSPPVKDNGREKRVTFAVSTSERSTTSESEMTGATGDLPSDPDVLAMIAPQQCKLCVAYAQRYREEQRERVKQEVTSATLGQALCSAEAERDKLKSGLSHIQSEIQRMKEETARLESCKEKTARELRRSEEDRSDLQLKLKVMSECVRKRDLELSIQRQALEDRDRRMKDAQNEGMATHSKLLMVQEQIHNLKTDNAAKAGKISELKDLLAEREKQHMAEMKKKLSADNPAVQRLITKAVEEARAAAQKEASQTRTKAEKEMAALRKDNDRMTIALGKIKDRFTALAEEKAALAEQVDELKRQLDEAAAASGEKDQKISELSQTLKTVRDEVEKLELQRKGEQTAHSAAIAFLENKVKQTEAAHEELLRERAEVGTVRKQLEDTEKRHSEESTLRRAAEARLSVLKKQLEDMTAEHSDSVNQLHQQIDQLRCDLNKSKEALSQKDKEASDLTEQLLKQKSVVWAGSRGRGDASTELETERRRSQRLQAELDRLTQNKTQLMGRLEHAERELERCAKKNEGWSKLWEEKVDLIRKLEAQVKMGRSINEDKVDNLRHERDRAMDLAKQAAKKLQTLDAEYQSKMDEMQQLFEAQLDGVRAAKDHEIQKSTERVKEIESVLREVSAETAASRSSLQEKLQRINIITKCFES